MQTAVKEVWLVAAGDDEENLSLTDVSVYFSEEDAQAAATELAEYLGSTYVFVQRRRV
jgi:hypothetical protein